MTDTNSPQADKQLISLVENIRQGVLDLLRPNQPNPPSAADLSLGLQTLKAAFDTAWKLADTGKVYADVKLVLADVERIKAETEKIRAGKA